MARSATACACGPKCSAVAAVMLSCMYLDARVERQGLIAQQAWDAAGMLGRCCLWHSGCGSGSGACQLDILRGCTYMRVRRGSRTLLVCSCVAEGTEGEGCGMHAREQSAVCTQDGSAGKSYT